MKFQLKKREKPEKKFWGKFIVKHITNSDQITMYVIKKNDISLKSDLSTKYLNSID